MGKENRNEVRFAVDASGVLSSCDKQPKVRMDSGSAGERTGGNRIASRSI